MKKNHGIYDVVIVMFKFTDFRLNLFFKLLVYLMAVVLNSDIHLIDN